MPVSDPQAIHTPATGLIPPASWGGSLRDNIVAVAGLASSGNAKPMCRAYRTADQSIATNTQTAVTFDGERYDVAGMHSTVSNTSRLTVPSGWGGIYHLGASVRFEANATGQRWVALRVSGTLRIAISGSTQAAAGLAESLSVACDWQLGEGDYVEMIVYQTSGGLLDVLALPAESAECWAHWIGAG